MVFPVFVSESSQSPQTALLESLRMGGRTPEPGSEGEMWSQGVCLRAGYLLQVILTTSLARGLSCPVVAATKKLHFLTGAANFGSHVHIL